MPTPSHIPVGIPDGNYGVSFVHNGSCFSGRSKIEISVLHFHRTRYDHAPLRACLPHDKWISHIPKYDPMRDRGLGAIRFLWYGNSVTDYVHPELVLASCLGNDITIGGPVCA